MPSEAVDMISGLHLRLATFHEVRSEPRACSDDKATSNIKGAARNSVAEPPVCAKSYDELTASPTVRCHPNRNHRPNQTRLFPNRQSLIRSLNQSRPSLLRPSRYQIRNLGSICFSDWPASGAGCAWSELSNSGCWDLDCCWAELCHREEWCCSGHGYWAHWACP
jgi:hypothetical protein